MQEEKIIISLGGSLIIPDEIDSDFLKNFREIIISQVKKGKKFVIVTGGGKTCRKYNEALLKAKTEISEEELDWLGIYTTRLNAHLIQMLFGEEYAKKEVIKNPMQSIDLSTPIRVGGGWKPGHSSDGAVVGIANNIGAKTIINLSNIDYVYDSDPRINPNAKKFEKISWQEYRELIPKDWNPGLSSPFDPVASEMCQKENIEVIIMNGRNLINLENYLNGESFFGTIIS